MFTEQRKFFETKKNKIKIKVKQGDIIKKIKIREYRAKNLYLFEIIEIF